MKVRKDLPSFSFQIAQNLTLEHETPEILFLLPYHLL